MAEHSEHPELRLQSLAGIALDEDRSIEERLDAWAAHRGGVQKKYSIGDVTDRLVIDLFTTMAIAGNIVQKYGGNLYQSTLLVRALTLIKDLSIIKTGDTAACLTQRIVQIGRLAADGLAIPAPDSALGPDGHPITSPELLADLNPPPIDPQPEIK